MRRVLHTKTDKTVVQKLAVGGTRKTGGDDSERLTS
ncbi:hypothetical protein E2C01_043294 [Portunus trituberculatus]|uniref:Uncharacterized protein n=1 Tax=Portunus trituberculatus TaxID=210409 RepID=A0A5B7FSL0_PORTR|nr:hypothetical protein [Portunus trituberculatus]